MAQASEMPREGGTLSAKAAYEKSRYSLLDAIFVLAFTAVLHAQTSVSINVLAQRPGYRIPSDFSGLSIETGSLRSGNGGVCGNWFDDSTVWPQRLHAQMITLFNNLGIRNIRVGGGSVDVNNVIPTNSDIDAFFRFVKATNVSVIYSLRLLNGDITQDTNIAKYVWSNYHQYIRAIAIGNEPDFHSYHTVDPTIYETQPGVPGTGFPSYIARWKTFASAVASAVPDVKFGGPDTGSNYPIPGGANTYYNGLPWTVQFAYSTRSLSNIAEIYFHNYTGQGASGTPQGMADAMLSPTWDNSYYPALYTATCVPVLAAGLPYRLTESNSFSSGLSGGSNCFATALYSLDYLHWWAAQGASGVNFHNKQWVLNDAIFMDSDGNYQINPMGYGIAAFKIGGQGRIDSVSISNPANLNLTAYAVADSNGQLFVTVLNKEHYTSAPFAPAPRDAEVNISAPGFPDTACVMYMSAPSGNVLATDSITLGGQTISNGAPFAGKWSPIDTVRAGYYVVSVPYASAAIVRIGGQFISLGIPSAIGPSGDTNVARKATLKWSNSSGAKTYEVQISIDPNFRSAVFDSTVTDTTIQLSMPLNENTKYYWHVRGIDSLYTSAYSAIDSFTTGTLLSVTQSAPLSSQFALLQNYPNPFNSNTVIRFNVSVKGHVTLKVYDVVGREVAALVNGVESAGDYEVEFNGLGFPSGVYFYRITSPTYSAVKKMILLK